MSYLAIARKYRPSTLAEIVGQEHVTRTLGNAIRTGRVHHAYLFCGARGVGKTTAARALARALNCAKGPTLDPCGACPACLEILAGASPDLVEIDGASNNSVDDIRELRETVHYAPTRGSKRIYLIDEVHMLSKAAFNALLKTLEEPPPHVIFLFATTEPHKVLDTILSRVQRFDFKRIPPADVARQLHGIAAAEGVTLSPMALRLIARAGDGSMRDAQSLLDKVIAFAGQPEITDDVVADALGLVDRGLVLDLLSALTRGDAAAAFDVIDRVDTFGFDMGLLVADLLEVLRDATFLRISPEVGRWTDLPPDECETLKARLGDVDVDVLTRLFHALLAVSESVAKASRPRTVLEMSVARLTTIAPLVPIAHLVTRLEELEMRQRGGVTPRPPPRPAPRPPAPTPPAPKPAAVAPVPPPAAPRPVVAPPVAPVAQAPAPASIPPTVAPTPTLAPAPPASTTAPDTTPVPEVVDPAHQFVTRLRETRNPAWAGLAACPIAVEGHEVTVRLEGVGLKDQGPIRTASKAPAVLDMLREAFGPLATLQVLTAVPRQTEVATDPLRKEVEADPTIARVVSQLGAQLDWVRPRGPE